MTTFTNSDWARCKETRKSSSAGATLLGNHTLKAYTRKEKSSERASNIGTSEPKGIVTLLKDLDYELKPVLVIDAKATEHLVDRQGIGKLSHIDIVFLWTRDEIRSKRLRE